MGMGTDGLLGVAGIIIHDHYGPLPHSQLSSSKLFLVCSNVFIFFCHAVQLLNPLSGVVQVGERVVHINGVPAAGQDLMLRPRWTQHGVLTIWRFHSHGGTPSHHPFQWDFPNKNHPAIRGNPHFRIPPKNVGPLNSQGIS